MDSGSAPAIISEIAAAWEKIHESKNNDEVPWGPLVPPILAELQHVNSECSGFSVVG